MIVNAYFPELAKKFALSAQLSAIGKTKLSEKYYAGIVSIRFMLCPRVT
jgi:hypothetical protein